MESSRTHQVNPVYLRLLLNWAEACLPDVAATKEYLVELFDLPLRSARFLKLWVAFGPRLGQFVIGFGTGSTQLQPYVLAVQWEDAAVGKPWATVGKPCAAVGKPCATVGKPWAATFLHGSLLDIKLTAHGLVDVTGAIAQANTAAVMASAGFAPEARMRAEAVQADQTDQEDTQKRSRHEMVICR